MKLTKTKPTKPGYYWVCLPGNELGDDLHIVEIYEDACGQLAAYNPAGTNDVVLTQYRRTALWSGRLRPPTIPARK